MILVGDWVPGTKEVRTCLKRGIILANLEGPVLAPDHTLKPAPKAGPSLFSTKLPIESGCYVFSLANNHLMDYGTPGLEATLRLLDQKQFKACGAGKSIAEARRSIIVEDNGLVVGIVACCEAQFGIARQAQAGTAQIGPWVYDVIRGLRQAADAVVVSVHASVEDSPWPSPYIQELYRSYIDAGATVVHGHHAHVPQGYEEYGGGVIFYGMGNFAVDPDKWRDYPNGMWSLGAELDFSSKPVRWQLSTFEIHHEPGSDSMTIVKSSNEEQESHRRYLEMCNRPLADPDLFVGLWQEVSLRAYYHYGAAYMRFSAPLRRRRRSLIKEGLSKIRDALFNDSHDPRPDRYSFMLWYHMIACESHSWMLATALGVLAGEIEDLRTDETRRIADEMMPWSRGVVPI